MKIISKMYRMKMLSSVRDFVENIPFQVVERQLDDCIYAGVGDLCTGKNLFRTLVKIVKEKDGIFVYVKSNDAGINEKIEFNEASLEIRNIKYKFMN